MNQAVMWNVHEDEQFANISPEVLAAAKVLEQLGGVRSFANIDLKDPEHDSAKEIVEATELGGLGNNMNKSKVTSLFTSAAVLSKVLIN
jgi:hypothetical protein